VSDSNLRNLHVVIKISETTEISTFTLFSRSSRLSRYTPRHFFIIKPTKCANFPNLLRHDTLHVSGSSSAHHQEFIHCTLSNGICHTGLKTAFRTVPSWSCSKGCLQTCMTYTSAECTVNKLLMMGRGTARNMWSFMPE